MYFKDCEYLLGDNEIIPYFCLRGESCCDYGCCITTFRKMAQFWYFWLILIFICMGSLACIHYYRKLREDRVLLRHVHNRRHRELANRILVDERCIYHLQDVPNRTFPVQIHHEPSTDDVVAPFPGVSAPPDYYTTVEKDAALYTEPPPNYSTVCGRCLQDNDTKLEVDIPGVTNTDNSKPEN
ncbi:PREDICTED: WW domain-binding protein 1-like [Nicrophorus vespilloides]|uniref:WW domain-binding protein 1-like n=1 Tax=Nicrophorus vespilloides TaxID=110193 RepID=A0ABM1MS90_NICVS|nr:PREDICTED: WW domain-binding protein 1-like [Nicrophorus vespilloides]